MTAKGKLRRSLSSFLPITGPRFLTGEWATHYDDSIGQREIREGSLTYIPRGVRHGILNVKESLTMITVFVPPLF